jgi:hypothetical protein
VFAPVPRHPSLKRINSELTVTSAKPECICLHQGRATISKVLTGDLLLIGVFVVEISSNSTIDIDRAFLHPLVCAGSPYRVASALVRMTADLRAASPFTAPGAGLSFAGDAQVDHSASYIVRIPRRQRLIFLMAGERWAASIGCIEIHSFLHKYPYLSFPTLIYSFRSGPGSWIGRRELDSYFLHSLTSIVLRVLRVRCDSCRPLFGGCD